METLSPTISGEQLLLDLDEPAAPPVAREEPNSIYKKHKTAIRKAIAEGPLKALAEAHQFINWKLEPREGGGMDKIPVDRYGWPTNAQDSANWMTAEEALRRGDEFGLGVGFVFTNDDPFVFVDIDHGLVNGVPTPFTCEMFAEFPGAYIETSQSGTGSHLFAKYSVAPPHKNKHTSADGTKCLEVYTQKRFVALTGTDARGDSGADCTQGLIRVIDKYLKHTGEVSTGDGGDTMERWYSLNKDPDWDGPEDDNTLIKLMSKSSSRAAFGDGVSFLDLYEANEEKLAVAYPPIGSGEPYDRSSADMALACRLAFWAGKDPERIERIMLQSKLKRDKWDNRPVNYLRVTILKACDKQTDVLGGKKKQDEASASARLTADGNDQKPDKAMHNVTQLDGSGQSADLGWNIVSIADIHTNPPKPQLFFIDGWLPAHVLTFFAGHGGTGKSMLALQAAVCLAMGLPFMGKATIKCRVLFFSAEDSTETIRRRLIKICIGMKIGSSILDETLEIIDATKNPYLFTEHTNKKGETTNGYAELRTQIKTFNANVIIIDNASDTFDANENNRAQVRAFVRALVQLGEESHTTVLLLAHVDKLTAKGEGSSESYSGVTAWHNSARSRWYLTSDGRLLTLQHKKSNFGPLSPGIKMGWSPEGLLISLLDNDPLVHREDILITVLALIKRHYENGSYISPASNSGTNAYNILKGEAEFPKSITRQMQLTPLLERAIKEGRLCVEEYKKDKNTQKRYKVNESTLI